MREVHAHLASHDDRYQCVKEVELCHTNSDRHLEQRETSESGGNELLQAGNVLGRDGAVALLQHIYRHRETQQLSQLFTTTIVHRRVQ